MVSRRDLMLGSGAAAVVLGGAGLVGWRQMGSMAGYESAVAGMRTVPAATGQTRDFIRAAMLAPNGHNTQPWKFRPEASHVAILPDFTRRTPVVDPDNHHVFVSLGCAAENLALAAGAAGRAGEAVFDSAGDGAVVVHLGNGGGGSRALSDAIPHRQSTRSDYDGSTVTAPDLRLLVETATVEGVDVVLMTDRAQMNRMADVVITGNTTQMGDPAFVTELKHWLRFSPAEALRTGDGLFGAASGNPAVPEWMGALFFAAAFTVKGEAEKYAGHVASSAGLVAFVGAKADPEHWVKVGRACQRFALQATALGLTCAFLNQPVEVPALRADLAALPGLPGRRPDLIMRFGRAKPMPFSARRPVEAVMA
jgi:nitroreductase